MTTDVSEASLFGPCTIKVNVNTLPESKYEVGMTRVFLALSTLNNPSGSEQGA